MVFRKISSQFLTLSLEGENDADLDADFVISLRRVVFSYYME